MAPKKNTLWTTDRQQRQLWEIVIVRNKNKKTQKTERSSESILYPVGSKSCSQKYDMSVDRMMESDVAKPLRMLSAYLMTAAMTRPPSAWRNNKHTDTDGRRHDLYGPTGEPDP